MSRLKEALDFGKLAGEGFEFQVESNEVNECCSSSEEDTVDGEETLEHCNRECIGIFDEEVYEEGEPFERIGQKMFDLVPDGRIKKRIIRSGDGGNPLEFASVKIHYNGYLEYDDQPFDSTYIRNKPRTFIIGDGRVIVGLDFAVQSMKLGEKSQFLIHPDYAFGKNNFIGRIPSDSTVLFEVELLEIVNSGATLTYERLSEDQQSTFQEIYKYSNALCEKGKHFFINHDYKRAVIEYNTAANKLEKVLLGSCEEVMQHKELSVRVYSNLIICYLRLEKPRKGCANAQKIYDLTQNGEIMSIPAKVYFNHAKCLRHLGEYNSAKLILDKAYKMEPKNPEVANEMLNLENDKNETRKNQKILSEALLKM